MFHESTYLHDLHFPTTNTRAILPSNGSPFLSTVRCIVRNHLSYPVSFHLYSVLEMPIKGSYVECIQHIDISHLELFPSWRILHKQALGISISLFTFIQYIDTSKRTNAISHLLITVLCQTRSKVMIIDPVRKQHKEHRGRFYFVPVR